MIYVGHATLCLEKPSWQTNNYTAGCLFDFDFHPVRTVYISLQGSYMIISVALLILAGAHNWNKS